MAENGGLAVVNRGSEAGPSSQLTQAGDGGDFLLAYPLSGSVDDSADLLEPLAAEVQAQDASLLTLARNYEAAGRHDLAKDLYARILDEHPAATDCCGEAQEALARLD